MFEIPISLEIAHNDRKVNLILYKNQTAMIEAEYAKKDIQYIKIGEQIVNISRFVENTAVHAERKEDLEQPLQEMNRIQQNVYNMKTSRKNTKVIASNLKKCKSSTM